MTRLLTAAVLAGLTLQAGSAAADGDVAKGAEQFKKCAACHTLQPAENKIGPSLSGLFGRKSGTVANFSYSSAMKNAGITWDEKALDEYLTSPAKVVKGTKMVFAGIAKPADRENLIAFLKEATKPK